eukprot:Skav234727  [mRNA]  locus=scaffold634:578477:594191:- [translate_table: standard]
MNKCYLVAGKALLLQGLKMGHMSKLAAFFCGLLERNGEVRHFKFPPGVFSVPGCQTVFEATVGVSDGGACYCMNLARTWEHYNDYNNRYTCDGFYGPLYEVGDGKPVSGITIENVRLNESQRNCGNPGRVLSGVITIKNRQ